jgi:hypothetical protein
MAVSSFVVLELVVTHDLFNYKEHLSSLYAPYLSRAEVSSKKTPLRYCLLDVVTRWDSKEAAVARVFLLEKVSEQCK